VLTISPQVKQSAQAVATELVAAVACVAVGLIAVLVVPGVADALRALTGAMFGRPDLPPDKARVALSLALTPAATVIGALLYRQVGRAIDEAPPAPLERPPLLHAAGLVAVHLVAAVVGSFALAFLMTLLGAPIVEQQIVLDLVAAGGPALASLTFSALVLAPLGEELFFRGLLFRRLRQNAGAWPAYLVSALLFASFHDNLRGMVIYVWLGLVFASAYARTGRLGCAIAVHFGNNAITLATLALL
jgi:membrane protease YdiL (CAAX protease family)